MPDDREQREIEAVAKAIETYGVAYSHVTLADMSTALRRWRVHKITDHAPTDDDTVAIHEDKEPAYRECRELNARAAIAALDRIRAEKAKR